MQDPFHWLEDDQLVESNGIVWGPGFIWPTQGAAAGGPPVSELAATFTGDSSFLVTLGQDLVLRATFTGDSSLFADLSGSLFTTLSGDSSFLATLAPQPEARLDRISLEVLEQDPAPQARLDRISIEVLQDNQFRLTTGGDSSFQATLLLGNVTNELAATMTGDSVFNVQPYLFTPGGYVYKPVNYPLGHGDVNVVELAMSTGGNAAMSLSQEPVMGAAISGDSSFQGTLLQAQELAATMTGDSVFIAHLGGDQTIEMAMTTGGDSTFRLLGDLSGDFDLDLFERPIYLYGSIVTGFDDTDDLGFTQTFTDGDIIRDFARYLYQYVVINVGFDYTDDASGNPDFISQTFPDGDIIRDWARYLYQYVNVTTEVPAPDCRLTIGPAPRQHQDLTPTPRPPRQRNR